MTNPVERTPVEIPSLFQEGIRLMEGDGDSALSFCRTGNPEDEQNEKFQDKMEFDNRYVCFEDPALQKHLGRLGVTKADWFSFNGYHEAVKERVLRVISDRRHLTALKNRWASHKEQLKGLDYIRENLELDFYAPKRGQEQRRDALLEIVLDPAKYTEDIRRRAVEILGETLYHTRRFYDRKTGKVVEGIFFNPNEPLELRKAAAGTGFIHPSDLARVVYNRAESVQLREEVVFNVSFRLSDWWGWGNEDTPYDFYKELLSKSRSFFPERLQVAAIAGLLLASKPLLPPPEGHYRLIGSGQLRNAHVAKRCLDDIGLTGRDIFDSVRGFLYKDFLKKVERFIQTKGYGDYLEGDIHGLVARL